MSKLKITNDQIVWAFEKAVAVLTIQGNAPFQIRAYQTAIDTIKNLDIEVSQLVESNQLQELPGIGTELSQKMRDLVTLGHSPSLDKLYDQIPEGVFALIKIPGVGPKKAYKLAIEFDIDSEAEAISKLTKAIELRRIQTMPGFGVKSEEQIAINIKRMRPKDTRIRIDRADRIANQLIHTLNSLPEVYLATALGSLRRRQETIGDIDIGISTNNVGAVISSLKLLRPEIDIQIEGGNLIRCLLPGNRQADIKFQQPEKFGATLQHFTGSKFHNIALREWALKQKKSLSEHGIKTSQGIISFATEEEFYAELGLEYIPPELRENTGEIEAASKQQLPQLITNSDIQGDFHTHTSYKWISSHDFGDDVPALLSKAAAVDYSWLALGDHNPSQNFYNDYDMVEIIKKRNAWIEAEINKWSMNTLNKNINVLKSLEVDIKKDGSLSVPDKALELLDVVLISIHSGFHLSMEEQTRRLIKAMSNPHVHIVAHPSGRLIQERSPLELNWNEIFKACTTYQVALEINANPKRLDLPDSLVRKAIQHGVIFALGTDAHQANQMNYMNYALDVARRGWVKKDQVLNTFSYPKLRVWLAAKKNSRL